MVVSRSSNTPLKEIASITRWLPTWAPYFLMSYSHLDSSEKIFNQDQKLFFNNAKNSLHRNQIY
jgi:hypothetical protein